MNEYRLGCYVGIENCPDEGMKYLVRGGGYPIFFVKLRDDAGVPCGYSCSVIDRDFESRDEMLDAFEYELARGEHMECLMDSIYCYSVLAIEAIWFFGHEGSSRQEIERLMEDIVSGERYVLEVYPELVGINILNDEDRVEMQRMTLAAFGIYSDDGDDKGDFMASMKKTSGNDLFDVVVFADADIADGGYPGAPEWITRIVELEIMLDGESVAWAEWEDNPDAATPNEAIHDAENIAMAINRELNTGFDLAAQDLDSIGQWIHSAIGDCIYWSTGLRDFEFGLYDAAFIGLASRNAASALDWRKKMSGKKVAQHGWVQTRERNIELDYFDEDELLDMYGAYTNEVWRKEDASGMVGVVSHHIGMADDWWTWDTYIFGAGADCGICDSVDEGIKMCEMSFVNPGFTVGASARSAGNGLRDDFIAAYMYSYGATRAEAESVFDDADDAFIEAVIEGWKGDAFRNFYDASLGTVRSIARRKTASTFELARKMFVSLVKMDYPYLEYAIQNDGYTVEMIDAFDDEGAIAAFLEKYPDAYVYDEPEDISNKWASRKTAQEEEPVSEDPEEAFADLVDKLRETSFENLGDELEDIIDDPKLYALLSEGFGNGELASVTMSTSAEAIPVQRLIPLQREIGLDNSLSYPLSGDPSYCFNPPVTVVAPIVTYNGTFIVDGHHRWSQVYMMNPDASINAINFSYGDQNPLRILRNFQGAIAVAEGEVPSQVVGVADVYSMSEDQIRSYIEDNIGQACVDAVCREVGLDSEDEVVEYILGNVMDLKQYAVPYGNAPARKDMPQTTEDAIDIAEDGQTNI